MDEELAALEAEFASLQSALNQPTTAEVMESLPFYNPLKVEQAKQQLMFDVPVGIAKAGAGLADILSYPVIKGAQLAGVSPETLPTFGASQLVSTLAEKAAPYVGPVGVQPETGTQELISFLSPSPLSKASVAAQAGTGLASYLGMKGAEAVAPESEYAGLVGALAAPAAVSGISKAASTIAPKLEEAGLGLQRSSIGLRKADITASRNAILETPAGDFTDQVTKSFNNLINENVLGKSRDPNILYKTARAEKASVEKQIQSALQAVDTSDTKIQMPSFPNATTYLEQNKVNLTDVKKYENIINKFQSAIKNESKFVEPQLPKLHDEFGNVVTKEDSPAYKKALETWQEEQVKRSKLSLDVINKQRKIFGEKYKDSPQSDPGFWRAFYQDLKQHIERYAPEVQDLNRRKQDLIVAEPVLRLAKKASQQPMTAQDVKRAALYTTGGGGFVGATYLAGGNPLLGALISGGLALAGTKRGQDIIGRGLRSTGSLAESLGGAGLDVGTALQRGGLAANQTETPTTLSTQVTTDSELTALETEFNQLQQLLRESQQQAESIKVGKQDVSIPVGEQYAPPNLVKAMIDVESSFDPKAVSPKKAKGLMQLMPGTASDLGLAEKDIFDPNKNVEAGSRYMKQQMDQIPDLQASIAAYNWGIGNVLAALDKAEAKGKPRTWASIRRSAPTETQRYVDKVLMKYRMLEA